MQYRKLLKGNIAVDLYARLALNFTSVSQLGRFCH